MKLHPRVMIVNKARAALGLALLDVLEKHGLSDGEALMIVNGVCSEYVGGVARHAIRAERHPGQPDKPGGLA
jgi:hypothetical protein